MELKGIEQASIYHHQFNNELLKLSESDNIFEAYKEWEFQFINDLELCGGTCICGKEKIRYEFYYENKLNGNEIIVGSECEEWLNEDNYKLHKSLTDNINVMKTKGTFTNKLIDYYKSQGILEKDFTRGYIHSYSEYFVWLCSQKSKTRCELCNDLYWKKFEKQIVCQDCYKPDKHNMELHIGIGIEDYLYDVNMEIYIKNRKFKYGKLSDFDNIFITYKDDPIIRKHFEDVVFKRK